MFLSGCQLEKELQASNTLNKNIKGEILFWLEMPPDVNETNINLKNNIIPEIIDQFQATHPHVKVIVEYWNEGEILDTFVNDIARGAGADLLMINVTSKIVELIKNKAVQPLDKSVINQSSFYQVALKQARYQGTYYGLPVYLSIQGLCYNKQKVKQPVTDLSQLIIQARKGYSVGIESGFGETFWGSGFFGDNLFSQQGNLIISDNSGWGKWIKWLGVAQNEPNFILSDDSVALQEAFIQDRLAYLTCSSSSLYDFINEMGKDKVGITLLPKWETKFATPIIQSGIFLINRASSQNQKQIALELALFFTNKQQQKKLETQIPFIPSNREISFDPHLYPIRSVLIEQLQSGVSFSLDDAEKLVNIKSKSEPIYLKALTGQITPELAEMQLKQILLEEYNLTNKNSQF